jgi:hypothetical protein
MQKYAIRKAILEELKAYKKAPITCDEMAEISIKAALRFAQPDEVQNEWNELANMGYIAPRSGFGGKYFEITEKGLRQLSPEFPQDEFIYGPGAIK